MSRDLTHYDEHGRPRMVDVSAKETTRREAEAVGSIRVAADTLDRLERGALPKGDPLVVAKIAGIQAAKRTADLIPFCHPLPLTHIDLDLEIDRAESRIRARAVVRVSGPTGVEMEALTAASVALLTVYDMLKAVDRGMEIGDVRVVRKSGGRSGDWVVDDVR